MSEMDFMPKLIVLFHAGDGVAATLAENAAAGARGVRFSEVDLRVVGNATADAHQSVGQRQRRLDASDQLRDYDGVIVACSASDGSPKELDRLLEDLGRAPANQFVNTVFALIGPEQTTLLARVARLGAIVVSASPGINDPEARATATGARVAKVVGWVRHALGHEQHDQHHHHGHEHHPPA
jgi:hypothetical protein